jgi:lipopolysaccharide biosynthesis glycosyltransferase
VVVAGNWLPLDVRWNVTLHAYRSETDSALRALVEQPRIVHYNASVKPWQPDYRLSQRELFYRYVDATQWSGWRPVPQRHALSSAWHDGWCACVASSPTQQPAADAELGECSQRGAQCAAPCRRLAAEFRANAERRDSRLRAHCRQRSRRSDSSHASARAWCRSRSWH